MALLPLSVLDLAPVSDGTTVVEAMVELRELAKHADRLGYERLWYAEHHGMSVIASSSPEVLIAAAAAVTERIHIGSGGVMLPNHVPLRVAETYRTLAALYPGRIDLGIGRAGGSDGKTLRALRSFGGEAFPEQLAELMAFEEGGFPADHPFAQVEVVPSGVPLPPIWLLGSSGASAQSAGQLGMGYAFAGHFSLASAALPFNAYRQAFNPSTQFEKPHAILCLSVLCAPTDEEAKFLSGTQELGWALFMTGDIRRNLTPEAVADHQWTAQQRAIVDSQKGLWIVGSPDTVREEILRRASESGADEVMIATTMHSYALRRRSFSLIAEAFGLGG